MPSESTPTDPETTPTPTLKTVSPTVEASASVAARARRVRLRSVVIRDPAREVAFRMVHRDAELERVPELLRRLEQRAQHHRSQRLIRAMLKRHPDRHRQERID